MWAPRKMNLNEVESEEVAHRWVHQDISILSGSSQPMARESFTNKGN